MDIEDGRFPFTRDELYQAFILFESEAEAREHSAHADGMGDKDWAMSEETLMLLSLGSETARHKVDSFRAELRELSKAQWLREQQTRTGLTPAALEQYWQEEVARQERDWIAREEELKKKRGL